MFAFNHAGLDLADTCPFQGLEMKSRALALFACYTLKV